MTNLPWALQAVSVASLFCLTGQLAYGQPIEGVMVRLDDSGHPEVVEVDDSNPSYKTTKQGLLVWRPMYGSERWLLLDGKNWPSADSASADLGLLSQGTRGEFGSVPGVAEDSLLAATIQLAPLATGTITRAAVLVTPQHNAELLGAKPTLRRLPADGDEELPADTAILYRGTPVEANELVRIPFAVGQTAVPFSKIEALPDELREGLPAGAYAIRMADGIEANRFIVADDERRRQVMAIPEEMAVLTGDRSSPLCLQFTVEHLLTTDTPDETPTYLGDVLDLLDAAPQSSLGDSLKAARNDVQQWLVHLARDPGYASGGIAGVPPGTETGFEEIDAARSLIAAGNWSDAALRLDEIELPTQAKQRERMLGLIELYRGVIAADAGRGKEFDAEEAFTLAIAHLSKGPTFDLLRAHNNFGNFYLQRAQDRLSNHAFQIAAGVQATFLDALRDLNLARQQYRRALDLATESRDSAQQSATRVNLARLYALLADVIRTLDAPRGEQRKFETGEQAAMKLAVQYASLTEEPKTDPIVHGVAEQIRAQVAFRRDDMKSCLMHCRNALRHLSGAGYLAGVEGVQRMLGLVALKEGNRARALRRFKTSHLLSELLRQRFPQDQVGASRAGFFSRRSYVYERIVELLIDAGEFSEALRFSELAKARAAQDILISGGIDASTVPPAERLDQLLANWPEDMAAVEYFLGTERCWVLVINPDGDVSAWELRANDAAPIASRQLVGRVRQFLSATENQASRMTQQLLSRGSFDHTWQDELYEFRSILMPDPVLAELRRAERVVIVPHHILHYFPFSALVIERDAEQRAAHEMVQPRFLIDEPFDTLNAPSIVTWDLLRRRRWRPLSEASAVGIAEVPGAPPLPGVAKDIQNFRAVFEDRLGIVYEDDQARENLAKRALRRRGVLLLATHGYNEPDQPLESYLLFLPESEEALSADGTGPISFANEGRLTAREVYSSRVGADLVVMSACYSGLGDRSPLPGDDLFGLQRAFLQAGAGTVVSGLWDVYDGTAPQLIDGFFQRIKQGKRAARALAESQRAFLGQLRQSDSVEPWLHPYFWAVYCVAGADHATIQYNDR